MKHKYNIKIGKLLCKLKKFNQFLKNPTNQSINRDFHMQNFRGRFMVHSKHLREKKTNFAYSLTVQINWGNKWENI